MNKTQTDKPPVHRFSTAAILLLLTLLIGRCDMFGGSEKENDLNGQWNLKHSVLDGEPFAVGDSLILVVDENEVTMYDYLGDSHPSHPAAPTDCYALYSFDLAHVDGDRYELTAPQMLGGGVWDIRANPVGNELTVTFVNSAFFEGVTETYERTNQSTFTPVCEFPAQKNAVRHRWSTPVE